MSMTLDEYESKPNGGASEAELDLEQVMAKWNEEQPDDTEPQPEPEPAKVDPTPTPDPTPAPAPDPTPEPVKPAPENPVKLEPDKAAENAANAERRRQNEERIARRAIENSPEYQVVKQIAEMSGKTVEQLQADLQAARIRTDLLNRGVPEDQVDAAIPAVQAERTKAETAERALADANAQTVQVQFQQWVARMETEKTQVMTSHPYLTQTDIDLAQDYMLNTLQNPNIPFEQAVRAVHTDKIIAGQREQMRTEILAEMSGRNNTPLAPQGSPTTQAVVLTADEKFVAKQMGISEADYIKYSKSAIM